MARVNLERRAEIGREKRARTQAAILEAARKCYSDPEGAAITIEAVTQAAGVAKGTFYVHFTDLTTLEAALGDAIIQELADRHESARRAVADPLDRMTTAVAIFLRDLAASRTQARLVSRAIDAMPDVALAVQDRLRGDLSEAQATGSLTLNSLDLAVRIVVALIQQAAQLSGAGKLDDATIPELVRAILRALGCTPENAAMRTIRALENADRFAQHDAAQGATRRRPAARDGAVS